MKEELNIIIGKLEKLNEDLKTLVKNVNKLNKQLNKGE